MHKLILTIFFLYLAPYIFSEEKTLETEAVELLQAYLQVDTISPPGNESRAVDFLANIFEEEGIEFDSA